MNKHSLTEILENPHFLQYAAILSVAMSPKWRMLHPEIPSVRSALEHRLSRLNRAMLKGADNIKQNFIGEWTSMFARIVEADPDLYYRTEDVDWFVSVLDSDEQIARTTFSMLFAVASTRREFADAAQVAEATGEAESTWRNRGAAGEIIGAFKAGGKAWMFPVLSLRAYGIRNIPEAPRNVDASAE